MKSPCYYQEITQLRVQAHSSMMKTTLDVRQRMLDVADYRHLIPESLHGDVDSLLYYLATFPFERPVQCYHCGHRHFWEAPPQNPDNPIMGYRCASCRRGFTQLTGTAFSTSINIHLWPDYARLRLSGLTLTAIGKILGVSSNACLHREKGILRLMDELYPKLHKWWAMHQQRTDRTMPKDVQAELNIFRGWVQNFLICTDAPCPYCNTPGARKISLRPLFRCGPCDRTFSLLTGTPLDRLGHIEHWVAFVDNLAAGYSSEDQARMLGVNVSSVRNWRKAICRRLLSRI